MVDAIVSSAQVPPAAQPRSNQPAEGGSNNRSAEVRLAEQKVEPTFDFGALAQAVAEVQEYSNMVSGRALSFAIDNQLNRSVITVVDSETESLVRQIPSEEILEAARLLKQQQAESAQANTIRGLLFDQLV